MRPTSSSSSLSLCGKVKSSDTILVELGQSRYIPIGRPPRRCARGFMLSAFLSLRGGGGQRKRKTDTKVAKCTEAKRVVSQPHCVPWLRYLVREVSCTCDNPSIILANRFSPFVLHGIQDSFFLPFVSFYVTFSFSFPLLSAGLEILTIKVLYNVG